METDVNEPKTKAVNAIFQNIKFCAYVALFAFSTDTLNASYGYACSSA